MKKHHGIFQTCIIGFTIAVGGATISSPVLAVDASQDHIGADQAKLLLGDGTGVVIGIIDGGIDTSLWQLAGNDSLGHSRLLAQHNYATDGGASAADLNGHATAVAGVILSSDPTYYGIASDARYVNARVSAADGSSNNSTVLNGVGYAYTQAQSVQSPLVLNISLNNNVGSTTDGSSTLSLMADYFSSVLKVPVVVSAGNFGYDTPHAPTGPADGYNVFSVGATWVGAGHDYDQPWFTSAYGQTSNGRSKPDLVAPGVSITTLNRGSGYTTVDGTSFAAPAVTGVLAAQIEYGMTHSLSYDPLVLKATMLNSTEKIYDFNSSSQLVAWTPATSFQSAGVYTVTRPLSARAGAGQVDAVQLYSQYSAGEHGPGNVTPVGWDLNSIARSQYVEYTFHSSIADALFTATLTWNRHVNWLDDGDGVVDSGDSFSVAAPLTNLNLYIYYGTTLIAQSISAVDNLEYLNFLLANPGDYTIRVSRSSDVNNFSEDYALAWSVDPILVPEPSAQSIAGLLLLLALLSRPHQHRTCPHQLSSWDM